MLYCGSSSYWIVSHISIMFLTFMDSCYNESEESLWFPLWILDDFHLGIMDRLWCSVMDYGRFSFMDYGSSLIFDYGLQVRVSCLMLIWSISDEDVRAWPFHLVSMCFSAWFPNPTRIQCLSSVCRGYHCFGGQTRFLRKVEAPWCEIPILETVLHCAIAIPRLETGF